MDINLQPGRYVVAVSGGVDSVALLHLLAQRPDLQLTVAHFDHGIRADSVEDRRHVQQLARAYDLPFVYHRAELGSGASEAVARQARYDFLHQVQRASRAVAIVTAHHQDDALETAILNLLRGTGRKGLSSLKSIDGIKRPLLRVPKHQLLRYAKEQRLVWHEDSTNSDERYLRNYIRNRIMPRLAESDKETLLAMIERARQLNAAIEEQTINYLHLQPAPGVLDRHEFTMLPHIVAREIMAEWLRTYANAELSRKLLERLVIAGKTGRVGTKVDINKNFWLEIGRTQLALKVRER